MDKHINIVGWLYIVLGGLNLLGTCVALMVVLAGGFSGQDGAFVGLIMGLVGILIVTAFSAFQIYAGFGVLGHQPWARTSVIILGGLKLLAVPVGTILGLYTLWVLLNDDTARLFKYNFAD